MDIFNKNKATKLITVAKTVSNQFHYRFLSVLKTGWFPIFNLAPGWWAGRQLR
jgi:hypothetical protein